VCGQAEASRGRAGGLCLPAHLSCPERLKGWRSATQARAFNGGMVTCASIPN